MPPSPSRQTRRALPIRLGRIVTGGSLGLAKAKQNAQKTALKGSSVAAVPVKRRADSEASLFAPTAIQNKLARLHPGSSSAPCCAEGKEVTPSRKALFDPNEPVGSAPLPMGSTAPATSGEQRKRSQMAKATLVLHPTSPDTEHLQRRTSGTSPSGCRGPSSLESLARAPDSQITADRSPRSHQSPGIPSRRRGSLPVSDLPPATRVELSLVPSPQQEMVERAETGEAVTSGVRNALPLRLMRLGASTNQGGEAPAALPAEEACPNWPGTCEETQSEGGEVEKRNSYLAAQPKLAMHDDGESGCQATSFESAPGQTNLAPSASCDEKQQESDEAQCSDKLMAKREADASGDLDLRPSSDPEGKGGGPWQDLEADRDSEPEANSTPVSVPETEVVGEGSLSPVEVNSDSVGGSPPPDPQEHRVAEASGRTPLWHVNGVTANHASISTVAREAVGQECEGVIRNAPRDPVHSASSSSIEGKGPLDPAAGRPSSDNSAEIVSGSCPAMAAAPACDLCLQRQACRTNTFLEPLIRPESAQNDKTAASPARVASACNTKQDQGIGTAADLEDASEPQTSDRVMTPIQDGGEIHHASAPSAVAAGSIGATGELTNSPSYALGSATAGSEEPAEEGRTQELSFCSGSSGGDDGLCFLSGDAEFALDLERSSDGQSEEADGKAPALTFPVLTGPDEGDASARATKATIVDTPAPQSISGVGILNPPAASPLLTAMKPPPHPSPSQPFHHRASPAQLETPAVPETPLSEMQLDGSSRLCTSHPERPLTAQQPQQQACMAGWDAPQSIRGANWTPAVRWVPGFVPGTSPRSSEAGSNYPASLAAPVRATPRRLSMSSAFHSQTAAASAPQQAATTPRSGNASTHLVLLRPKKDPPSNASLCASCVALGIPGVVHQVPFFGNPSDADNHTGSNIIAGRRFKVPTSLDIPPFRTTYAEAAPRNTPALQHSHHCLVPAQRPPSRAATEDWLESRRRRRGNHSVIAGSRKGEKSLLSDLVIQGLFMYFAMGTQGGAILRLSLLCSLWRRLHPGSKHRPGRTFAPGPGSTLCRKPRHWPRPRCHSWP